MREVARVVAEAVGLELELAKGLERGKGLPEPTAEGAARGTMTVKAMGSPTVRRWAKPRWWVRQGALHCNHRPGRGTGGSPRCSPSRCPRAADTSCACSPEAS